MFFKLARLNGLMIATLCGLCACTAPTLKRSDYGTLNTTDDVIRYTTDVILQELARDNAEGVSIALVDKTRVIWSESFGVSATASETKLSPNSPLPIASVSKVFTAIAIQQLAEQGKVDLDATLSLYIPELETYHLSGRQPRLRDLLSHYSGIPSNHWARYRYTNNAVPTLDEWSSHLEDLPKEISPLNLVSEPGDYMVYSNLAYSLLGLVVQRTSGMAYTDYIKTNILDKIGMGDSAFVLDLKMQHALNTQYQVMERIDHPVVRDLPAGGLMASTRDLSRFIIALLNQTAGTLSPSAWKAMYTHQHSNVNTHGDIRMGLGVFLSPPGVPLGSASSRLPLSVSHGGDLGQYHSEVILLPNEGLGVAVLTVSDKNRAAADRIADAALSSLYEARIGTIPEPTNTSNTITHGHSIKLEKLAGYYASELGLVKIEEKKGRLHMNVGNIGALKFVLKPQEDQQSFSLNAKLLGFIPLPSSLLNIRDMTIVAENSLAMEVENTPYQLWLAINNFRIASLIRLDLSPIPNIWLDSIGEYVILDSSGSIPHIEYFSIRHDQDSGLAILRIKARGKKKVELPLNIINSELAVISGYGRDLGASIKRLSDGRLQYSGLILEMITPK